MYSRDLRTRLASDFAWSLNLTHSGSDCYDSLGDTWRTLLPESNSSESTFAMTSVQAKLLENLEACFVCGEPVLLVGDTGTGKTALVQEFARQQRIPHERFIVYNFNDQSDASDILGQVSPIDTLAPVHGLRELWLGLMQRSRDRGMDSAGCLKLVMGLEKLYAGQKWKEYLNNMQRVSSTFEGFFREKFSKGEGEVDSLALEWLAFRQQAEAVAERMSAYINLPPEKRKQAIEFRYQEGLLIKALREGMWLVLDEINLAPLDVLHRLHSLFDPADSQEGSGFVVIEDGGRIVERHPDFRVFACMNPPSIHGPVAGSNVGKKDLPRSVRQRFTEIFVDELTLASDLEMIVRVHLRRKNRDEKAMQVENSIRSISPSLVKFYQAMRREILTSGRFICSFGDAPTVSLRTLTRILQFAVSVSDRKHLKLKLPEAVAEGVMAMIGSPLQPESVISLMQLLAEHGMKPRPLLASRADAKPDKNQRFRQAKAEVSRPMTQAAVEVHDDYVLVEGHPIKRGPLPLRIEVAEREFIVTDSVRKQVAECARLLSGGRYPLLLEGLTSAGKTSLVEYLCRLTGHTFLRINNHEHTDIQEYIGQHVPDPVTGLMIFEEGPLVKAARNGDWIVLDELNLAPSEVLESLNRLLDDNRELVVPGTGAIVRAHDDFMLFATQNPAGNVYGGRKVLSRALRNRFVEVHVSSKTLVELQTLLEKRCQLPTSDCKRMVAVYNELHKIRLSSAVFNSEVMTIRGLLRWGRRWSSFRNIQHAEEGWNDQEVTRELAREGYFLFAEGLRDEGDKTLVMNVLRRCVNKEFEVNWVTDPLVLNVRSMFQEAVKNTPTEELPSCLTSRGLLTFTEGMCRLVGLVQRCILYDEPVLVCGETGAGKTTAIQVLAWLHERPLKILNCHQNTETADIIGSLAPTQSSDFTVEEHGRKRRRVNAKQKALAMFQWQDGPLTASMRQGNYFLLDEISLTDDAVLERFNSVLEPSRFLTLVEKGSTSQQRTDEDKASLLLDALRSVPENEVEHVKAHATFRLFATMNPGGDYGKKELSPALRDRMTELWCPAVEFDSPDMRELLASRLPEVPMRASLGRAIQEMIVWFNSEARHPVSIREALVWADFIHSWKGDCAEGFVHGGLSTLVDGLGTGNELLGDGKSIGLVLIGPSVEAAEVPAFDKTLSQSRATARLLWCAHTFLGCTPSLGSWDPHVTSTEVSVGPFCATGPGRGERPPPKFTFLSPTTRANLTRLLRSMHTPRAVLLEGSPGVGKTSLVCSLAEFIGQPVTKVNVSEHTDVGDLLGYVLPKTDNEDFLEFAWQDGVLLTAMKEGRWIILDELNLANQQVLESLNALLDHRREVYVPQIDRTIRCAPTFRLFATQNPLCEGGGRKGLPRSFLNRFSRIMVDALSSEDLNFIGCAMYPNIAEATIKQIIDVVDVFSQASFRGSWEWNLRDVLRILALVERRKPTSNPGSSVAMLAMSRLKCPRDRSYASDAIRKVFSDRLDFSPAAFRDMLTHGMPESLMTALAAPPLPECAELPLESDCLPIATPKPFILKELEAVAHSVRVGIELTWPVLLTGPPMSGKATLVRQIALEHHATLIEIFLTESVDAVELLGSFEQLHSSCDSVKFGWVDGNFVRAVESGQWVLFRHAHMAPAAVLDRLNSILEADGELLITECGEPRQLRPHPEFRCFFTAQGVNGISRALRNRCHEVDIGLPTLWGVPCGPHRNLLSGWDDLATRILTQIPLEGIPGVEPLVDGDSLVVPAQLSLTAVDLCDAYRVARRHASVDVSYVAALIFLLHLTLHRFSDSLQVRSRMPTLETLPDLAHSHRSQIVSLVRLLALGDDPWAAFTQSFRGTLPTAEPLRSIFQAGVRICSSEDLIGRLKPLLDVDDPIERCFAVMEAVDCPIEKASLARGLLLDAQTLDIPRVLSALSSRLPAGLLRHSTLLAGVGAMLPASTCYPSVQAAFVDGERDLMSWARLYEASVMFCISPHWQTLENPAFTIDGQLHVTAVEAIRRLERRNLLPGPLVGVFGIQFWMEMEFTVDPRWDVGEIEQADLALRSLSWLLHHLVEEVPPFALDGNAIAYKHELSGSVSRCRDAASMLSRSSFSAPAALAALHADITSSAVSKETPLDRAFYPSTRELPQVAVMKAVVSGLFGAALPDRRLVESVYLTTLSPEKLRTLKYSYGLTDQGVDLKGLTLATRFLGLCEVAEALQHQRRSDKAFAMQSMLCTQLLAPLRSPVNQTTSRLSGVAHSPGTALTTAVGMFSLMSVVQEVGHFSRYAGNNALHATQRLQSAVKLLSLANLPLDEILPVFDFSTFVQLLGAWMAYLWTAQDGCDMDITDRLLQKCSSLAFKLLTPSPEASRGPGCPQLTSWVTWQDSLALYGPVFKEEISVPATSNLSLGEVSPFISADFVCPFAASFVEMSKECGMVHLPCIRRTLRLLQRRLAFQQPSTNWSDLSSLLLHVASFLDFPEVANRPLPELTSAIEARLAAVTDNNPAGLITRAVLASLLWLADASDDSTWVPLLQTCIGMGRLLQDPCRSHSVSKALSSVLLESRSRLLEYFTLQMDQVEREELRQRLFRMETGRLPSASGVCAEDFKQTAVWIRSVLSEHVVRRDPLQWSDLPTSMSRHIEESEAESTLPVQESNLVLEMLLQRGETKRLKRTIASLESSSHTEDLLANHQKWCREIGHQFGMEREIHSLLQDQKAFLQDAVFDPNSGIWNCLASPLQRVATEGSAGLLDAFPAAFAVMGRFRQLLGGYVQRSIKRYPFFRDLAIPVETAASMVVQGMDQLCCQLSPEAVALRSQLKGTSDAIIGHVACFGRQPLLGLSQAVSIHFAVDETATEERNEEAITVAVQQSKVADLKRRVVFKPILSPMLDPQSLLTLTQWGLSWLGTYHNHCRRFSERSATQAVIKLVSSLGFLCVEVERRAREEETRKLQGFLQDHVGRATDVAGITENHVWWEGTRQEERKELLDTLFPNADTTSVLDRLQIPESALGSHQEVYNHYETGVEEKDIGTAPLHVTNQGPFALTRAHVEHVVELLLDAVAPVGEAPSELTYRKAMGLGIHVTSKIMRHALNSRPTPQNVESLHVLTLGALRSEEALFLQERLTKEAEEEMHLIRTLMKDDTVVALAPLAGESDEEMQLRVDREDYLRERARKVKFKELQRSLRNSMKLYNSAASSFYADANPTLVAPSWNVVQSLLIRVDEVGCVAQCSFGIHCISLSFHSC
ncbi:MAG: uncharacterized protein KVP18_001115 [Porospora cf. gigantea A]|uniref:uncharacterized protein n=1 Tax=Porospora cf. gigantea A TaxID=2853593 RepID=UPI0035595B0A|nr:MAG: hypothetical protein KVP18_001115 [Porospora cf. gigantea A]